MPVNVDVERAREILRSRWEEISKTEPKDFVKDKELSKAIERSINSKTKSYRYAILTQVLAKATDPSVDCRCLQKKRGGPGAFDARSLCRKVIVDFDGENDRVLGGSGDPYVSKPLRHKEISKRYRNEIKDKRGWDNLHFVLNRVEGENDPDFTRKILNQMLLEIKRRLSKIAVTYPTPSRISLDQAERLIRGYLSKPSEGARPEVIACSLFRTFGEISGLYDKVILSKTTAANYFLRRVANIECYDSEGNIVKAVEPKDRELTKADVMDKLPKIRERGVSEFLFVTSKGVREGEEEEIKNLIKTEFESGRNIYIDDPVELSKRLLTLFGEEGRKKFLENAERILEEGDYPYKHRKEWAELLEEL